MKRPFTISICLLLLLSNRFVKAQTCHAGIITALRDTSCAGIPDQLTVTGSNGNIQWQSASNDTFINVTNATDSSLKTKPLLKTTYLRVVASNALLGVCVSVTRDDFMAGNYGSTLYSFILFLSGLPIYYVMRWVNKGKV